MESINKRGDKFLDDMKVLNLNPMVKKVSIAFLEYWYTQRTINVSNCFDKWWLENKDKYIIDINKLRG